MYSPKVPVPAANVSTSTRRNRARRPAASWNPTSARRAEPDRRATRARRAGRRWRMMTKNGKGKPHYIHRRKEKRRNLIHSMIPLLKSTRQPSWRPASTRASTITVPSREGTISTRRRGGSPGNWMPSASKWGGHLEQPNDAKPAAKSMNHTKFAGIASPAADADPGRQHPEEPTAGMPASFSQWGHTAARTARTLLGRCHVFMDEHDVDEWIDTATSTFHKAVRAGRAQCVASCNNAGS